MSGRYFEGIGRRKTATARVRLYPGDGEVIVNGRPFEEYFPRLRDQKIVLAPLEAARMRHAFGVSIKVEGGGVSGQADAVAHGLARALLEVNPELRSVLRQGGFLTRDPREKERKKPGLKRARKAPQYTKR
ncbi:MAG: 30S ribosomal protein S9 [Anaerolineae bacterium]